MLVIEYQYKDHDGTIVHIANPLKDSQPVSIGRSNQNTLCIKNDRSISRKHIQFEWVGSNNMFHINNYGKVTMYQGKYLKVEECIPLNVSDIKFPLIFKLGTLPVQVSIKKINLQIIETRGLKLESINDQLRLYDININTVVNFTYEPDMYSYLIEDENINPLTKLSVAITKIPIVSKKFIFELLNELGKQSINFSIFFATLTERTKIKQHGFIESIKGFNVLYLNKEYDYERDLLNKLSEIVNKFQGSIEIFDNDEIFERYLQLRNSLKQIIILKHPQRIVNQRILTLLGGENNQSDGIKIYTIDEFIDKLRVETIEQISVNYLELNHEYDITKSMQGESNNNVSEVKKATRSLEEPIEQSPIPVKKKRLTRRKIQALNPLDFFVGGSQDNQTIGFVDTINQNNKVLENGHVDTKPSEISKSVISQSLENHISTLKKDEDEYKIVKNGLELTNESPTKDIETYNYKDDLLVEEANKFNRKDVILKDKFSKLNATIEGNSYNNIKTNDDKKRGNVHIDYISNMKKHRRLKTNDILEEDGEERINTKDKQEYIERPNTSLVETIQSTKTKEINRYRSNMVQVDPKELTEEAINKFSNMALIETDPSLMKVNSNGSKEVRLEKGEYAGRKNFKKFVKRWPRGSPGGNDSLTNSVRMFTRQFVQTKPYSMADQYLQGDSNSIGEAINERFASKSIETRHNRNNKNNHNIQGKGGNSSSDTEDLSRHVDDNDNSMKKNNSSSNNVGLFVDESEDEDSWLEPGNNNNTHNMDRMSIMDYSINEQGNANSNIIMRSVKRNIRSNSVDDEDNDSDDSEEGPRFQFKSRKTIQ